MPGFFKQLKKRLFAKASTETPPEKPKQPAPSIPKKAAREPERPPQRSKAPDRPPYFVQIGVDFGTSFTKVVCRDVLMDSAWVHMPQNPCDRELPFLTSSAVCFKGQRFSHPFRASGGYPADSLHHVKMALQSIGLGQLESAHLQPFKARKPDSCDLATFVELTAIYLLTGVLGEVRSSIAQRSEFKGTAPDDQIRVNLAIPVADANEPDVQKIFERVLKVAWVLSETTNGFKEIPLDEMQAKIREIRPRVDSKEIRQACHTYPEIGAAVHGFIRSRASVPGLYLFSDTGAGTVDQCVFRFARNGEGMGKLYFYSAQVLDLGSSRIERIAAGRSGRTSPKDLEKFRRMKESGEQNPHLKLARREIAEELSPRSYQTIAMAKLKLNLKEAINDLKVIFGGGGHCEHPYRDSVMRQFDSNIFRRDKIDQRRCAERDFARGMPDLTAEFKLRDGQRRWSPRLAVAHGLSFVHGDDDESGDLVPYELPGDIPTPSKEMIIRPIAKTAYAPTKDDC